MKVYRIEHRECKGKWPNSHHGPTSFMIAGCQGIARPSYGYRHVGPESDTPPLPITNRRCGVTIEQLPEWWSIGSEWKTPKGWSFAEYEVPEHLVRVGKFQVTFPDNGEYFVRWVGPVAGKVIRKRHNPKIKPTWEW